MSVEIELLERAARQLRRDAGKWAEEEFFKAVAHLLELEARFLRNNPGHEDVVEPALAIARAYLGEEVARG